MNLDKPRSSATSSTVIKPSMLSNFETMLKGWLMYCTRYRIFSTNTVNLCEAGKKVSLP